MDELASEFDRVLSELCREEADIRAKLYTDASVRRREGVSGKKLLDMYENIIKEGFNTPLGTFQQVFVNHVIRTNAKSIAGPRDWEQYGQEICKEHDWNPEIDGILACSAPRRIGKTYSLARCVAGRLELMALHKGMGHVDIQAVFSTGKRISVLFKECLMKFLVERNLTRYLVVNNQELIVMEGPTGARAYAYFFPQPKHEEGLRGVSANAIYLEEGGFMNDSIFFQIVVPLLKVKNSILVIISSPPRERGHWFAIILEYVDAVRIEYMCEDCKKEWKVGKRALEICPHMTKYFPDYHQSERDELIQKFYTGRDANYAREILGITLEDDQRLFTNEQIEDFLHAEYKFKPGDEVDFIVVTCDPNVTNTPLSDEMALVAGTQINGNFVVCFFGGGGGSRNWDAATTHIFDTDFTRKLTL